MLDTFATTLVFVTFVLLVKFVMFDILVLLTTGVALLVTLLGSDGFVSLTGTV